MSALQRLAHDYAWVLWLAAPLTLTLLAALWLWWRGRSRRAPGARTSIAEHHRYLQTLTVRPVGARGSGGRGDAGAVPGDGADTLSAEAALNPPVESDLAS